jgi:Lipopolysaccharide-assembly, LptC-related
MNSFARQLRPFGAAPSGASGFLRLAGLGRGPAKGGLSFALVAGIVASGLADEPAQLRKIDVPVPIGHEVKGLRVPVRNEEGKIEMQFDMESAKRLNDQDIEIRTATIQTYNQQTAKPDAKIELKTAVMNLDTNVIKTGDPVRISREDFVLTADGGEFNSKLRQGRVLGSVHLIIYDRDKFQTRSSAQGQQQ